MTLTQPTQIPPAANVPKSETPEIPSVPLFAENPLGQDSKDGQRGGANLYGGCSIEVGCGCSFGTLRYTHEDAQGWLDYVKKFTPLNFWYQDCGVQPWLYYEPYDDWQDTYGVDAVMAFYHSGHGGMDANGVFYLPMSKPWGNEGCTIVSSSDKLVWANERVRYIFLSTCLSLRVLGGHNPIRTWNPSNRGWRMLFGYETVSWDNPNYGKFFWEEWNKNKSLSTAWLDASWRIAHDQAPSVVACGASADEAKNRLFNERYFSRERVSNAWYWWRWYNVARSSQPQLVLPQHLLVGRLQPPDATRPAARSLAARFGLDLEIPSEVGSTRNGSYRVVTGEQSIAYGSDGSIDVRLATPNRYNYNPLAMDSAQTLAQEAVWRYGLDQEVPVVFDRIILSSEAGGTANGSGQLDGPFTTGVIVQFRQLINGVPVITPGAGTVRIALDNDGTVTDVHSSVRSLEQLSSRPVRSASAPPPQGDIAPVLAPEPSNYEQLLAAEFSRQLASLSARGGAGMPLEFTTVPNSTEIGYDIDGDEAILIARKAIEVNFGNGYRKRYWVTVPLFG
ncbi:DUF6345 domain-containing protein [Microcystis aeruginosa]|jgi:hypothetical protein|uniref:Uncharacterized protein n=1 Tax=Microcystis aeruginosa Ma_QC_B_20070730_S2 TaxID=2486256 RepID=A0A552E4C5_MICAE|nr:DUF6345 domain-containing protein [Microcystis aeruginosa]TRU29293.1 MAG: hypothetical protein EWV80_04250 [Microcystis aeruginosa Ma_QC_B_20070730_S2]TYT71737.1 hypothetical protein FXO09_08055 [Microcystis aeruginosa KLA2]